MKGDVAWLLAQYEESKRAQTEAEDREHRAETALSAAKTLLDESECARAELDAAYREYRAETALSVEAAPHIVQVVSLPNLGLGARENDTQLYGLDTKGRLWKFRPQYGFDAAWISVDAQFLDANGSPFVGK